MKHLILITLMALCLNLNAQTTSQKWLSDAKIALQAAENLQKPILIFVTDSNQNAVNKLMDSEIFDSENFKNITSKIILLKLEVSDDNASKKRLAAHYTKQKSVPALALLNAQGETVGHTITQFTSETISEFLDVLKNQLEN